MKQNCAPSWIYLRDNKDRDAGQQNIKLQSGVSGGITPVVNRGKYN